MKILLCSLFILTLNFTSKAQVSLEQQIADTACVCLNTIDQSLINSNNNGLKTDCLQQAMLKNQENINKQYETELRKEEDEEKHGLKGSLMIKVQNILAQSCTKYQLFEKKVQERRGP